MAGFGVRRRRDPGGPRNGKALVEAGGSGTPVPYRSPRLTKGAEVYCEGRLTLRSWTDDGKTRTGLSLTASLVQPMGQIGRRKPKVRPRDEQDAVPLNDAIPF